MAKSKNAHLSTSELNARVFAMKAERRLEKAAYSAEHKLAAVQKLRDAARDLRTNSQVVRKGVVVKKVD